MKNFKHILCATDLDEEADNAIRQADQEARRHATRVTFLAVVPYVDRASVLFPHFHKKLALDGESFERRVLEGLTERVKRLTGRKVDEFETAADSGTPDAVVVRKAEELGADLVVISGPNSGAHERAWLGSMADRVVRYAHCPVLVARQELGGHCIDAATDFSDPALPAIEAAALQARLSKRRLILLHSLEVLRIATPPVQPELGLVWPTVTDAEIKEFSQQALKQLEDAMKKLGVDSEAVVSLEPPASAIIQLAKKRKADKIVVGTTGRTGLPRLVLGSVAEAVVRDAPCSVLVVRLHP